MDLTKRKVLIVGGGCFGLSTAVALAECDTRPASIVVLDRFPDPPAPDAASSDLNKIIRAAYGSELYTNLAIDAIEQWKTPFWQPYYHESGFVLASTTSDVAFIQATLNLQKDLHRSGRARQPVELPTPADVAALLPEDVKLPEDTSGFLMHDAGWGSARKSMEAIAERARQAGVELIAGTAVSISHDDSPSVTLEDGRTLKADTVIVAAGSWTNKLLPELQENDTLVATGQYLGTMQLTPEEAAQYRNMPVVLSTTTGWYIFPPNEENIIKVAVHGAGYLHKVDGISMPRTKHDIGDEHDNIPPEAIESLRADLRVFFPALAQKDFEMTRLCWYMESQDGSFVIDWHTSRPNVFLATGDTGHAYKFLPTLGELVLGRLRNTLSPELAHNFSATRPRGKGLELRDDGYAAARKTLDASQLGKPVDLRAISVR